MVHLETLLKNTMAKKSTNWQTSRHTRSSKNVTQLLQVLQWNAGGMSQDKKTQLQVIVKYCLTIDFNIDFLSKSDDVPGLFSLFNSFGLYPHIFRITRPGVVNSIDNKSVITSIHEDKYLTNDLCTLFFDSCTIFSMLILLILKLIKIY